MTPRVKEAIDSLKEDLYNYPEMIMITVSRRELELIINYIDKENKKNH